MTWLDLIMILILGGSAVIQAKRGFLQSLLDLIALAACAVVSKTYGPRLGGMANLGDAGGMIVAFVLLGGAGIAISKLAYNAMPLTIEAWDPLFGAVLGLGCGGAIGHLLVNAIVASKGTSYAPVANSSVCMQLYSFGAWHSFVSMMHRLGGYEEPTPEP